MALSGDRAKLYDEEAKRKSGIAPAAELEAAMLAVRESAGAAWVCARLDAAGKVVGLHATGAEGGLAALRAQLADDAVSWCAFNFSPGYPYGEGSVKQAFLTCIGPAVGAMKKGKVALQKAGVMEAMPGTSMDVGVFQGAAEATDAAVLEYLRRNMPASTLL
jgi:hypothetical protein